MYGRTRIDTINLFEMNNNDGAGDVALVWLGLFGVVMVLFGIKVCARILWNSESGSTSTNHGRYTLPSQEYSTIQDYFDPSKQPKKKQRQF